MTTWYNAAASSSLQQPTPNPGAQPGTALPLPQQIRFRHITADQGLSSQRVAEVLQDREGFMWFGTTNGLNRYDGYSIVKYRNDPTDPYSLVGNFISDLIEDRSGMLWVGTTSGLSAFDRKTGRFTRYLNDPTDALSLSGNAVNAVYEDHNGTLWVGTTEGLNALDRTTGRFTRYLNSPFNPRSLSNNRVLDIYEDSSDVLWVGTDGGLNSLDRTTGRFTRYLNDPANPRSLSNNSVWDILEDHSGTLWLATDGGGLNRFDRTRGAFDQFRNDPANPHSLSNDRLESLFEDPSGALWVGTFGGGLSVLDPSRRTFNVYQHDPTNPTSLSSNVLTRIYSDLSGLIWLGTIGGGVDIYNPQQQAFTIYQHDPNITASLASDNVTAVFEDRDGLYWVGTMNSGLDRLVPAPAADGQARSTGGEFVHYVPDPNNALSLANPYVRAFLQDRTGTLWVGTYGGGLHRFDPTTNLFTRYRHDPANPQSLSDDRIIGIVEDNDGQLWVATVNGLNRFDPARGSFTSFLNNPSRSDSVSGNYIWSITKDQNGIIWAGTFGNGLNRIEPSTGKITRYRHDPNNLASLNNDGVDALLVDRAGVLWIGMYGGGLDRFNPADETFTHYRESEGLASDEVMSITEDGTPGSAAGDLWIVTGNALSRLDQDRKTFRTYDANDGLPSTRYTGAHYATRDGVLLIGSEQGLIAFDPATLQAATRVPPVAFTALLLENKLVPIAPDSPLPQSINQIDTIQLSYQDRVISFEFSALAYRAPIRNRYRYKLEGFDPDWIEVDSTRRLVTYTNLNPGRYVFLVTASNGDGVWNPTDRSITLIIAPPLWETTWFRTSFVFLLIIGLFAAYRWRVSSLERRQVALESAITERTADLAHSNSALHTEIVERIGAQTALEQVNTDLGQRVSELSALNDIARVLTSSTHLTVALQTIGTTIAGMFGSAGVGIWMLDESRRSLSRVVAATNDQTITKPDTVLLIDDPVAKQMVVHPTTEVTDRAGPHSRIALPPHLPVADQAGSCLLVPLLSHGELLGMLCIRAVSPARIFTPADAALAQTVAATIANAVETARYYTEAQSAAAEEERKRLARELHDSVSQALYAANLTAEILPSVWESNPSRGRLALENLYRFTSSAVAEMRMLLVELRPKAIIDSPLHDLLLTLINATSARCDARIDQHIDFAPQLPPDVKVALYRLAQEALNNIVKHAEPQHITIALRFTPPGRGEDVPWTGKAEMLITDDGRGFDTANARHGRLGLDSMRERAAGIGATLNITSTLGSGTEVFVRWASPNTAPDEETT